MKNAMLTTYTAPDDFLSSMGRIMRDPDVVKFFRTYFSTWSDTRASLMLMNVYILVEEEFESVMNTKPREHEVAGIVRQLMLDSTYRRMIIDSFNEYTSNIHTNFQNNIRTLVHDKKLTIKQ